MTYFVAHTVRFEKYDNDPLQRKTFFAIHLCKTWQKFTLELAWWYKDPKDQIWILPRRRDLTTVCSSNSPVEIMEHLKNETVDGHEEALEAFARAL